MDLTNQTASRLILAIEATSNLWSENSPSSCTKVKAGRFSLTLKSIALRSIKEQRDFMALSFLYFKAWSRYSPSRTGAFSAWHLLTTGVRFDAHAWACNQLQGGLGPVGEWIGDWYALACDGENEHVQRAASIPFVPGETVSASIPILSPPSFDAKSWRAPAWLFAVSPLMGFGPLKSKNVPDSNSAQRLSGAHTRLLLKGMRKVFLSRLRDEIATARNEVTAAAGAIAATSAQNESSARKRRLAKPRRRGLRVCKSRETVSI